VAGAGRGVLPDDVDDCVEPAIVERRSSSPQISTKKKVRPPCMASRLFLLVGMQ